MFSRSSFSAAKFGPDMFSRLKMCQTGILIFSTSVVLFSDCLNFNCIEANKEIQNLVWPKSWISRTTYATKQKYAQTLRLPSRLNRGRVALTSNIRKFYNFFPSDDHFDQNVSVKRSEGSMNPKKVTCGTWQVRFSSFTEPLCILYWQREIKKERMKRKCRIVRHRVRLSSPSVLERAQRRFNECTNPRPLFDCSIIERSL